MITLRLIEDLEKDYEVIRHWWPAHGWPALPIGCLTTMGLIAEENGVPLAAAWVYTATNASLAMLEWMVTNPAGSKMKCALAVARLTEFACEECTSRGYAVLFTTCKNRGLEKLYQRAGFEKTDENVTHFVKVLQPAPTLLTDETLSPASAK